MKKILLILAIAASLFIISCNSHDDKTAPPPAPDPSATDAPATATTESATQN